MSLEEEVGFERSFEHVFLRRLPDVEGAQQFSLVSGHFYEENVNLYWDVAKGTMAKANSTHRNTCTCAAGYNIRTENLDA